MKKSFVVASLFLVSGLLVNLTSYAANPLKIGHIDTQKLVEAMPEADSAKAQLEREAAQLEKQLEVMQVEYNNKLDQYMKEKATYSSFILQTKEAELADMQTRIQNFQGTAQQEIQKRNGELFQPILDKAKKAIEEVAAENAYTYIIDEATGILLYKSEDSNDVLPLVKAKLGLK